jgi:O-antigen ligase
MFINQTSDSKICIFKKDFLLLIFIVISEFFWYPRFNFLSAKIRIVDIFILLSFIFFSKKVFNFIKEVLKNNTRYKIFFVITFFILLSAFFSVLNSNYKLVSLKKFIQLFENVWLLLFAIYVINKNNILILLETLFLVSLFHIIFAIFYQYFPNEGDIYMVDLVRISGLSSVYFATYMLATFIFLFQYYIFKRFNLLLLLFSSLFFVVILITQIRTIWLILFIVIFCYIFLNFKLKILSKYIFFLIISLLLFKSIMLCNNETKGSSKAKENKLEKILEKRGSKENKWEEILKKRSFQSAKIRIELWKASYRIFKTKFLFGSGIGTYGKMYKNYLNLDSNFTLEEKMYILYSLSDEIDAHSQFFTRLAELGIFGVLSYFILFIFLFVIVSKKVYKVYGKNNFIYKSLFCFVLASFVADIISDSLGLKLFWIFSGIIVKLTSEIYN